MSNTPKFFPPLDQYSINRHVNNDGVHLTIFDGLNSMFGELCNFSDT